jgi:hypothetical protein
MASWPQVVENNWPPYTCSWIVFPPILHLLSILATPLPPQMLHPPTTFPSAHLVGGPCNIARPSARETSCPGDVVLPDSQDRHHTGHSHPRSVRRQSLVSALLGSACLVTEKGAVLTTHPAFLPCILLPRGHRLEMANLHNSPHPTFQAPSHPHRLINMYLYPSGFCLKPQTRVELEHPA